MQAVPRCMGLPQTPDRLEEIFQASAQFGNCPHQPVQEVSGITETRSPASRRIHVGVALLLSGAPFCLYSLSPILLYALLVGTDSTIQNHSLRIGIYSIAASFIQLIGYGTGFWRAWWNRCILGKDEFEAFKKNFYK